MTGRNELPPDMAKAAELLGGPERLFLMVEAMSSAGDFLQKHGWAKFGVVMAKGPHRVVLSLDGAVRVASDVKDAQVPEEVHTLIQMGRRHDA